jgi:hypothetical protein
MLDKDLNSLKQQNDLAYFLCKVQVGHIFESVKLIWFSKRYLGGSLAPPSQTVKAGLDFRFQ